MITAEEVKRIVRDENAASEARIMVHVEELSQKVEPMVQMFSNINWGEKVIIKVGIFLGGLVAFIVGIIEIIRFLRLK